MTGPSTVGPYRVVRLLGRGGMGDVFLAADDRAPADRREVAVKVLRPDLAADDGFRRRFRRELEAVQRVRGRSVARILGADLDAERPWIASEYVPGPTLRDGRAGVDLRALAAGLARALADIHAAGVVHRDLTPSNVLLGPDGPRVVDFGIAWFDDTTTLTRTGTVLGTPAWMAPEQLGDDRTSAASDVWAWGAVVTFAATGRPPVAGSRPEVIQVRAARGELDLDGVPDWLRPLVEGALDPDPARRPTADRLAVDLGAPTDAELTQLLERTWVDAAGPPAGQPGRPVAAPGAPAAPDAVPEPAGTATDRAQVIPDGLTRWAVAAVLTPVGVLYAWTASFLPVVLVIAVLVIVAAVARVVRQEREPRPPHRWVPTPGSFVVTALAVAGSALASAFGLLWGLVALLLVVAFLVAIGIDSI
ncbi:MAG: serine/threonine protein kinase [Acidimicrobiales bacterium]|nr:serine/threonine protein kinase [Acidimicrobiales bacterium]MCB9374110.1 serine/threonine protein kinase [Microthrixaceae bacterium]